MVSLFHLEGSWCNKIFYPQSVKLHIRKWFRGNQDKKYCQSVIKCRCLRTEQKLSVYPLNGRYRNSFCIRQQDSLKTVITLFINAGFHDTSTVVLGYTAFPFLECLWIKKHMPLFSTTSLSRALTSNVDLILFSTLHLFFPHN